MSSASHLSCDLQWSFPSILSADSELSRLVDQAAGLLESRPISLNLKPQDHGDLLHIWINFNGSVSAKIKSLLCCILLCFVLILFILSPNLVGQSQHTSDTVVLYRTDLIWVTSVVVRDNVGHEGAVLDVFFITGHMDGVFSRLSWPVTDVT